MEASATLSEFQKKILRARQRADDENVQSEIDAQIQREREEKERKAKEEEEALEMERERIAKKLEEEEELKRVLKEEEEAKIMAAEEEAEAQLQMRLKKEQEERERADLEEGKKATKTSEMERARGLDEEIDRKGEAMADIDFGFSIDDVLSEISPTSSSPSPSPSPSSSVPEQDVESLINEMLLQPGNAGDLSVVDSLVDELMALPAPSSRETSEKEKAEEVVVVDKKSSNEKQKNQKKSKKSTGKREENKDDDDVSLEEDRYQAVISSPRLFKTNTLLRGEEDPFADVELTKTKPVRRFR